MMDNITLCKLLVALIDHPFMISFIDEDYADELEDRGYFDLAEFHVTAQGRDFLAANDARLRS